MIRSIAAISLLFVLSACSPGIALEGFNTGKSLVDAFADPPGTCKDSELCGENYTTVVAQALAEVCELNLGDADQLKRSARNWTADHGKQFPASDTTVWHFAIKRNDLKVAYIAIPDTGSDCSVGFVNDVANLAEVKAYFSIDVFSNEDLSKLSDATVYGVLPDRRAAVSFTAFSIEGGKQARGVTFMTKSQYDGVEMASGAPSIEWNQ